MEEEQKEKNKAPTQAQGDKNNEGPSLPPSPPIPSGSPTADQENLQKVTEVTKENTPSETKMEPKAPEPPSGDATKGQHSHETTKEDSTKNAAAGSPAETTTSSSTSASGSGDHVQNNADEDDAQSPEGQHDSLETRNTNITPTVSETASQTPETITVNTTDKTKSGEIDGSTAVSHATSPLLLLLLVACAAAVVAA
ncbi:mucin-associated surface protein (MASP), putative [Trypanosoma cruzi]|nr:mucin-associated surface protein (MASP), putative [Trypanosoma cruzi]